MKQSLIGEQVTVTMASAPEHKWVGKLVRREKACDLNKVWYRVESNPEADGKGAEFSLDFTGPTIREINGNAIVIA